jgi:hypothetical protein
MDWAPYLEESEAIRWEGKPAPRCFVFRNWRHSVFGLLLLLFSVFWEMVGLQLGEVYDSWALPWIPVPFVAAGLWLAVGHLLLARLEWEKVFYAVTDRRVLARRGFFRLRLETVLLSDLTHFRLQPLGAELGSFRVTGGEPPRTVNLSCIEHPRRLTALLESALAANNRLQRQAAEPVPAPSRD